MIVKKQFQKHKKPICFATPKFFYATHSLRGPDLEQGFSNFFLGTPNLIILVHGTLCQNFSNHKFVKNINRL